MDRNNPLIYKASIFRFLSIHILIGFVISAAYSILSGSIYAFLATMAAVLISAIIGILLIDARGKDIILKPNELEGPVQILWTRYKRVSIPYKSIDLGNSKKRSFFRSGFIITNDGHRILLYLMYFSRNEENQIFEILKRKTNPSFESDA
jgi:hypothetical protein